MKELNLKIAILSFLTERNLQQFLISFYLFSISGILAQERSWFTPESAVHVRGTRKQGFKNIPKTHRIGDDKDKNSNSVFYFKMGPLYLNN